MAARITPSRGSKPDKLMRDALILELKAEKAAADGTRTPRIRLVMRKLVDLAEAGDLAAITIICNRVDGKAMQPIGGDNDHPLEHVIRWKSSRTSSTASPAGSS
jgi:hypothetical protein